MYTLDEAKRCARCVQVKGWCFKAATSVQAVYTIINGTKTPLQGHGLASEDVAQHFGDDARNSRFDFTIETPSDVFEIEYKFADGSTTIIPIDLTGSGPTIIPIEHRVHNRLYSGRFRIQNSDTIASAHFLVRTDDPDKATEPIRFSLETDGLDQVVSIKTEIDASWSSDILGLLFQSKNERFSISSIATVSYAHDRSFQICGDFFKAVSSSPTPLNVLEIGSRARSGIVRKHQFGESNNYIGMDILPGPNVDLVGDIHKLSNLVEHGSLDAIAGFSVLEHVAMPWKAAIEINKVLKKGGRCLFHTHQTWPVHESPCDFWRYSVDTWRTIFNRATGFKIVDSACGGAATIHRLIQNGHSDEFENALGFTSSTVLVEKVGDTSLSWEVDPAEICPEEYPE